MGGLVSIAAWVWIASWAHAGILPESQVTIDEGHGYRTVQSNGLPNHDPGTFPNEFNPHTIVPQQHRFVMPRPAKRASDITQLGPHPFGVAINGVPFDPGEGDYFAANPRSGWQYEPLADGVRAGFDRHGGHVQPDGSYHYHGVPHGLIASKNRGDAPVLLGWAADGFPIYGPRGYAKATDPTSALVGVTSSWQLKPGVRTSGPGGAHDGTFVEDYTYVAGSGMLDACNGRYGITPDYPKGTYHYVITESWPVIPRCFRGQPDPSFTSNKHAAAPPSGPDPDIEGAPGAPEHLVHPEPEKRRLPRQWSPPIPD